jgi:hypothetical protein
MSKELKGDISQTTTSSKNIKVGSPPSTNALRPLEDVGSEETAVAALEQKLLEVKAEFLTERFTLIFVIIVLVLALLSKDLAWFQFIFVALLSLVLLIFLADWWKVPGVKPYLDKIFEHYMPRSRKLTETEGDDPSK